MADSAETPRRPVGAYFEVAAVLPPGYFTTPPPDAGVRLIVTRNSDRLQTRWDMTEQLAAQVVPALTRRRHLQVHAQAYDERARR